MFKRGFLKVLAFLILIAVYPEGPSLALMDAITRLWCLLSATGVGFLGRFSRLGSLQVSFWEL
jgi:hypothetical protein